MTLTNREMEVLQLIAKEQTTEEIAESLHVSIATIESHRRNMFKKIGVSSVVGLVKAAIKHKWIKV